MKIQKHYPFFSILLFFFLLECRSESTDPQLFFPLTETGDSVSGFRFADTVIKKGIGNQYDPFTEGTGRLQALRAPAVYRKKAWPFFEKHDAHTCFLPQGPYAYYYERGLAVQYCFWTDLPQEAEQFLLTAGSDGNPRSSWPQFAFGPLFIRTDTAARLRDSFKNIKIIYNGSPVNNQRLALIEKAFPDALHLKSPLRDLPGSVSLPVRFPGLWYFTAVEESRVHFVYPLPSDANRFLNVTVNDAEFAEEFEQAFHESLRIAESMKSILKETPPAVYPYVSEAAFKSQRNITSFIQIVSDTDSLSRITVSDGSVTLLDDEVLLLAGGAFFAEIPSDRYTVTVQSVSDAWSTGRVYSYEGYALQNGMLPPHSRSITADQNGIMKPFHYCPYGIHESECSGRGYHPAFHSIFSESPDQNKEKLCRHEDLRLTEWNPFGIYTSADSSIQAGGKFIEFQVMRECDPSALLLYADQWPLDLPFRLLYKNEIILFTASQSLFRGDFFYTSDLRSVNVNSSVCSVSLPDLHKKCYRNPLDISPLHYVHGHRNRSFTSDAAFLKAVHSLIFINGTEVFHPVMEDGFSQTALLPLYRKTHAMSPGAVPEYEHTEEGFCDLRISELMPQGAKTNDGASAAGDEFAEFIHAERYGVKRSLRRKPGLCIFAALRSSSGAVNYYALPPLSDQESVLTIIKENPVCFEPLKGTVIFSSLSLPNAASVYTLSDPAGTAIQNLAIDAALYSQMDSAMRRSLYLSGDSQHLSDGGGTIPLPCSLYTRGSPGFIY